MRQALRELLAFLKIGVDNQLLLAREGFADALGVHVQGGLHVAADPGAEAQYQRQLDIMGRLTVHLDQRRTYLLIEMRHDAVKDLAQIENRMLALIRHRQAFARVIGGLPVGGHLATHLFPKLSAFARSEHRIAALEQQLGDALLAFEDRAPCGLNRVGHQHRLNTEGAQQLA